jgi:cystathionine beta-lyase
MKYDFDKVIDRRNSSCLKWGGVEKVFGDKDVLPMWVADMDFEAPQAVKEAVRKWALRADYGYTVRPPSFYQAFLDWVKGRHGWDIKKEWMLFTPGGVPALNLSVMAFSNPGDKVIIQPPVYYPFFLAIKNNGRELVYNRLRLQNGRYEMDFADLESKIASGARLLILCSPHNPVGRVWQREELLILGEMCLTHNVVVVSDEIHADLIFEGHAHVPAAAVSEKILDNTVTIMAPSKTFNLAGIETCTVITSNQILFNMFNRTIEKVGIGMTNTFGVAAFEAAYRYGEEWLEQLMQYLQGNVEFLLHFFEKKIPKIKVIRSEGTYLVWLDCRALNMDAQKLKGFMITQAKVGLDDGQKFGPGGEGFQRINIACPRSILEEGLKRIEKAVNSL